MKPFGLLVTLTCLYLITLPASRGAFGDSPGTLNSISAKDTSEQKTPRKLTLLDPNSRDTCYIGAGCTPQRSLFSLLEKASTIIVGKVISSEIVGRGLYADETGKTSEVTVWQSNLRVEAELNGEGLKSGDRVRAISLFPYRTGPFRRNLETGQYGIVFLAEDGMVVDLVHPIVLLSEPAPALASDQPPLEAVRQLLLASLQTSESEEILVSSIEGLLELKDRQAPDYLAARITEADAKIAAIAAWGLLCYKDSRAFPYAVDMALRIPPGAGTQICRMVHQLCLIDDPKLSKDIIPLLASPEADFRWEALSALRRMKDPANAPVLAKYLDDPDEENAYVAMMGLGETLQADSMYLPCFSLFKEKPQFYLGIWKASWRRYFEAYKHAD
jgi:hypothetical protein